jgi:hypothetical protein
MATEGDPILPDASRVARRALSLAAVVCRSLSDHDPTNPDAGDLWERLKGWVNSQELDNELEDHERVLIYSPLGSLSNSDRISATWRVEGLAVLAWSLGLFPFPLHDAQVDPYEVTDCVALLNPEAAEIVESAMLRSDKELHACRELYYAIHCRLRQFAREQVPNDIRHWIEDEWIETLRIDRVLDESGDLSIQGVSVSSVDGDVLSACESTTYERHLSAIWLTGEGGPLYSEVTVDT